jgi:hypothetical protein
MSLEVNMTEKDRNEAIRSRIASTEPKTKHMKNQAFCIAGLTLATI